MNGFHWNERLVFVLFVGDRVLRLALHALVAADATARAFLFQCSRIRVMKR